MFTKAVRHQPDASNERCSNNFIETDEAVAHWDCFLGAAALIRLLHNESKTPHRSFKYKSVSSENEMKNVNNIQLYINGLKLMLNQ